MFKLLSKTAHIHIGPDTQETRYILHVHDQDHEHVWHMTKAYRSVYKNDKRNRHTTRGVPAERHSRASLGTHAGKGVSTFLHGPLSPRSAESPQAIIGGASEAFGRCGDGWRSSLSAPAACAL